MSETRGNNTCEPCGESYRKIRQAPSIAAPIVPRDVFNETQSQFSRRIFAPLMRILNCYLSRSRMLKQSDIALAAIFIDAHMTPLSTLTVRVASPAVLSKRMAERHVRQEVDFLINELGLSEKDAYSTLGLDPDGHDPLLAEGSEVAEQPLSEQSQEATLSEIFPEVPKSEIEDALRDFDGDIDKASEHLLSWQLVKEEMNKQPSTSRESKQIKQSRKLGRKSQKALETEENDISIICAALRITPQEARALYWTHENKLSEVLLSKAPVAPLSTRTAAVASQFPRVASIDLGEYSSMSRRELISCIQDANRRVVALKDKFRRNPSKKQWDAIVISDTANDLSYWLAELRMMQLALQNSEKLASSGMTSASNNLGNSRIDLHGCTLDEAKAMIPQVLDLFKQSSRSHLEIITGAGRHSARGQPVLKNWLRQYLKEANVRMEELEGSFVISQRTRV